MSFLNFKFLSSKKIISKTICFLCFVFTVGTTFGQKKTVGLTVFIHGTVASTFSILSPMNLSGDALDESTAQARAVNRFRNHTSIGYDHICGLIGFHEFVSDRERNPKEAAQYLIPAYDDCMTITGLRTDVQKYAVFGWSGLLHNAARKKAGYELYRALCDYRDRIVVEYGVEPEVTLVAHSHGGNVALYLAQAEIEQQKKLNISHLIMYGSPMMSEMAHCIESDMFKTIVMLYSKGDEVQPRDIFSSKNKKSHQCMADIVDRVQFNATHATAGHLNRYDVCCIVDENCKTITHTNMWLVGRSTPISKSMDLLPLMVITPAVMACIDQLSNHVKTPFVHANLHIIEQAKEFKVFCVPDEHSINFFAPHQELLKERLFFWDECMLNQWQEKDDRNRHPLFNKKTMEKLLRSVFFG